MDAGKLRRKTKVRAGTKKQTKEVESGVEIVESSSSWGAKWMAGGQNFEQESKRDAQED